MMDAAPVQCINCEAEQPFERIYCAHCGCSLDAAKPLGQTWAGTFLVIGLFFGAAIFGGIGAAVVFWNAFGENAPTLWPGLLMSIAAAVCIWGIWRLARR